MSEREAEYEKMMKAVLGSYDSVAEKWISINKKENKNSDLFQFSEQ